MAGFRTFYPYEYVSGVARLNGPTWGVEIYLVNRGGTDAMGSASIIEALDGSTNGIFGNAERFNSGEQVVPPVSMPSCNSGPTLTISVSTGAASSQRPGISCRVSRSIARRRFQTSPSRQVTSPCSRRRPYLNRLDRSSRRPLP